MFMWDLRDVLMMRTEKTCEDKDCMRNAAYRQVWHNRETELTSGVDNRLTVLLRTSFADEAVFEIAF